jgi:hypothetical protein
MDRPARTLTLLPLIVAAAGCGLGYTVPVATTLRSTIDVARFQRVLVAGFAVGANDPIDTNTETVRLLRSQLRTRSGFAVIGADPVTIDREHLDDTAYWRLVGEEYRAPLIVTGAISFQGRTEVQAVTAPAAQPAPTSRRTPPAYPQTAFVETMRYTLDSRLLFIDGATGGTLHTATLQRTGRYDASPPVFPLSAYFDLMDRVLPDFLRIVSDQVFYGSRTLLK